MMSLVMTVCVSAEPVVVKLWPTDHDKESAEQLRPTRGDGVMRITDVDVPTMAVYRTSKGGPAVLVFPGGGYSILAINKEGTEVAKWLNGIGVTACVVKYRVPNNREGAFEDGQRAIRLVRQRAKEWGIDPQRVGVMGFSAGGHLSARMSTNFKERSYAAVDEADEQSGRPDFCVLIYPAYLANKKTGVSAKELPISADVPPMFIAQTKDDTGFVTGTQAFDVALKAAGVPSVFHLYEKGGHGYGLRPSENEVSKWPVRCEEWLKTLKVIGD